ncbi:MAG: hypothetical protein WCX69_02010 [Candidatus Paceibacterota bacterium]
MEKSEQNNQITSKQRVRDHGEVFTQEREVNAMLDLVRGETERIESRFLEPACGTGNFLAPVLERKLAIVKKRYGSSRSDFERMALAAASSIYGVEILSDNVAICIDRLYNILNNDYAKLFGNACKNEFGASVRFEDASLAYAGINKHEGEDIGLFDTVITPKDYGQSFENNPVG